MNKFSRIQRDQVGFTLVELVIGIVVLAIALLMMSTLFVSQSKDAMEPIYRLQAAQLGQSILNDVLSRAYDENSDYSGGLYRCGEIWGDSNSWYDSVSKSWTAGGTPIIVKCTSPVDYGVDPGEVAGQHQNFNDVDDFIQTSFVSVVSYGNVLGENFPAQMKNYAVKTNVAFYSPVLKEISVIIKTPSDEEIVFSALKGNY